MRRIIFFSFLFGFLLISPFLYQKYEHRASFSGIYQPPANDVSFYMARINDVLDGHPLISNAYLWEHKDSFPQQVFLAEYLLAQPLKLLKLSIQEGIVLYTVLLGALTFFLVALAFSRVSRSKTSGLVVALVFLVGVYAQTFLRPVSPQFNFIFFLTQFLFLWQTTQPNARIRWFIASGINFGVLFYLYPYYWTFYLTLIVLLLVYAWFRDRRLLIKYSLVLGIAAIIAIPYIVMMFQSLTLPEYGETLARLGMIETRFPSGIKIVLWSGVPLLAILILIWRKRVGLNFESWFFILSLVASIVVVNQHVITGQNLEFSSHYRMGAVFFSLAALSYLPRKKIITIMTGCAASIAIVIGMAQFVRGSVLIHPDPALKGRMELITWLNANTARDSVIFTNNDLSDFLPGYTHNNVFFARNANLFIVTDQEILDRFLIANYFVQMTEEYIAQHEREIFGVYYLDTYSHLRQGNKLRKLFGLPLKPEVRLPPNAIERVMERSAEIHRKSFEDLAMQYRIDYFVWDQKTNPPWPVGDLRWSNAQYAVFTPSWQ